MFRASCLISAASALLLPNPSRRNILKTLVATPAILATPVILAAPAGAQENLKHLYKAAMFARKSKRYAPGERRTDPDFQQTLESPFVGKYSDPNHPGGSRTITLFDKMFGDFRLASVEGGGGQREAEYFKLNAMVFDRQITVDFTPKGGPPDLTGWWTGDGILWPDDNKWPRIFESAESA